MQKLFSGHILFFFSLGAIVKGIFSLSLRFIPFRLNSSGYLFSVGCYFRDMLVFEMVGIILDVGLLFVDEFPVLY